MKIISYTVSCEACPYQVEGELEDGRWFYFRARHGHWRLSIGKTISEAVWADSLAAGDDHDHALGFGGDPERVRDIITTTLGEAA